MASSLERMRSSLASIFSDDLSCKTWNPKFINMCESHTYIYNLYNFKIIFTFYSFRVYSCFLVSTINIIISISAVMH